MCRSPDSWCYPPTDPAPPTPTVVVSTDYFGGGLTPPPSPLGLPATFTADDYAPCPPTPRCVPPCTQEEETVWSNTLNAAVSQSTSPRHCSASALKRATSFEDPLAILDLHVSGCPSYGSKRCASPNPVLRMIERAIMDSKGLESRHTDCDLPTTLDPCHIPVDDHESFDYYYNSLPPTQLCSEPEDTLSYRFSIGTIQELQHDFRVRWRSVNPEPIPPVIIRLDDLIQPYNLLQREDAHAFVVPTKDGILDTLCQRGIDSNFRPISPSAVVDVHHTQHIVASKFAVNVFLESPRFDESVRCCDYLGAYVLEVEDILTIDVTEPFFGNLLHLPYVRFHYYMWDESVIQLADRLRRHYIVEPDLDITQRGYTNGDSDGFPCSLASILKTSRHCHPDVLSTCPSSPTELDYDSFLDFSPVSESR